MLVGMVELCWFELYVMCNFTDDKIILTEKLNLDIGMYVYLSEFQIWFKRFVNPYSPFSALNALTVSSLAGFLC